jgi:hypothetical protein
MVTDLLRPDADHVAVRRLTDERPVGHRRSLRLLLGSKVLALAHVDTQGCLMITERLPCSCTLSY